jgi:hypothetical protein
MSMYYFSEFCTLCDTKCNFAMCNYTL